MKIFIYSPYFSTLGGGEKYTLDLANSFPNDEVFFLSEDQNLLNKMVRFFPLINNNIQVLNQFKIGEKIDYGFLTKADLFFYQCDGSLFVPRAKKNFLLIQSPAHSPKLNFVNLFKIRFWQNVICNSSYTAGYVKKNLQVKPAILNPAIEAINPQNKENIILNVGRFFPHMHSKKQEILIEVFKSLVDQGLVGWRLVLIGMVSRTDLPYLELLKKQSQRYPVEIFDNLPNNVLQDFYAKSKIYWHAAGFNQDLKKHPENAEHFGISIVEAISAGCFPLAFRAGGPIDILRNQNDFLWETKEELRHKTWQVIREGFRDKREILKEISLNYSYQAFKLKLYEIISKK